MVDPIEALRIERKELLELCAGFDEEDWTSVSGCPGWSVKDLLAHLASLYWLVVDPSALPEVPGLPTEEAQDLYVRSRRASSPAEVLADYETVSERALEALAGLASATFEVPLGDLGTYQASVLPSAFCFDHYTHIRADLFAPRGPLTTGPPASDELRLVPALDWIEAALPQQNQDTLALLTEPVELQVTGVAPRTFRIGPAGRAVATVRSDALPFVLWVTQRAAWEEVGAEAFGSGAALEVVRQVRVF
jgi:uncharacterized protein (TIGR03083 family)